MGELAWHLAEGDAYMSSGIEAGKFTMDAKPPNIERPRTVEALAPGYERWIGCKPGFFLPVRVLSRLFRRLFLRGRRSGTEPTVPASPHGVGEPADRDLHEVR